jgi:hypothetical protein
VPGAGQDAAWKQFHEADADADGAVSRDEVRDAAGFTLYMVPFIEIYSVKPATLQADAPLEAEQFMSSKSFFEAGLDGDANAIRTPLRIFHS